MNTRFLCKISLTGMNTISMERIDGIPPPSSFNGGNTGYNAGYPQGGPQSAGSAKFAKRKQSLSGNFHQSLHNKIQECWTQKRDNKKTLNERLPWSSFLLFMFLLLKMILSWFFHFLRCSASFSCRVSCRCNILDKIPLLLIHSYSTTLLVHLHLHWFIFLSSCSFQCISSHYSSLFI